MAKNEERHILAVKDYESLLKDIDEGSVYLPGEDMEEYKGLLKDPLFIAEELKELKKFIRKTKAAKKEVIHHWEGLMLDGYTLLCVEYTRGDKVLRSLCDGEKIKLVE